MIHKENVMPCLPGDPQCAACVTGTRSRRVLGAGLAHRGVVADVVSQYCRDRVPLISLFSHYPG